MIGGVAKCQRGVVGIVLHRYKNGTYSGITFDNKDWVSTKPIFLTNTVNEYIQKYILNNKPMQESK